VERFLSLFEKKGIEYSLQIGRNEEEIEVDATKLKLAIGSIIDNALNYTPKKGKISIAGSVEKGRALIKVTDNGIGIPKEEQEKVFSKFFRATNSLKVKTDGNGLDMYVAKTIIENHNGKIWFESEEGKGTSFFIEIPVSRPGKA
jgi:signal transduction histidine kinase